MFTGSCQHPANSVRGILRNRAMENMARFLKMPLTEFAGCWQDPVNISQTCAIFGETELVGYLLEGVEPARIAAGVNASVARRALAMICLLYTSDAADDLLCVDLGG